MDPIIDLLAKTLAQVWVTFTHNWPFLIASVVISVALKLYLDQNKVAAFLIRHRRAGVIGATAAAVGTPLCSCGTTAVILGMMASTLPWAPIIAFMVSSPLSSPEGLVYSAGLFGWPFAIAFFVSSILLGLFAGLAATLLENRGWFVGQARYAAPQAAASPATLSNVRAPSRSYRLELAAEPCGCGSAPSAALAYEAAAPAMAIPANTCGCSGQTIVAAQPASTCGCSAEKPAEDALKTGPRITPAIFLKETWETSKKLLPMFAGFAFIGYFLNNLIPAEWVSTLFGSGNAYSVPLAATLGLPFYINSEASLPLVRAMLDGGMSQGAAMAFLITGSGTSVGAMMGALTIARWRVVALVVGLLWIGALALGFLYNALLAAGLF